MESVKKFERENRYIVIKRSDLKKVPVNYRSTMITPMFNLLPHLPRRECVVVESDWPEYEIVWAMIEHRMGGKPVPDFDRIKAENQALQLLLNNRDDLDDQLTSLEQRRYAEQQAREAAERDAERYRWLRQVTPYRFKKIQDAAVTDGGDVMYFHSDRFDAAVDAAIEAALNPTAEAVSNE